MSAVLLNIGKALFFRGIDWRKFARRYDLEPFSAPCNGCGAMVETTLPFAHGDFRGLAGDCPCGHRGAPYCLVKAHGDLLD